MLKGLRRYSLATDTVGRKSIQIRASAGGLSTLGGGSAAAPQSVTGTTTGQSQSTGGNKKNIERYERDFMESFIQYNSSASLRKIQNDIFFFDPIVGTVVETRSNLPFSNFEISGTSSKERRQKYTSSVNAMQIRSMLPRIARERMVEGYHISYMNFDDETKKFVSIIPHSPEYCSLTPIPVYGRDPLIDVNYPDHILNCVKSEDEDMKNELERYAEDLLDMIKEKKTRLDPKFTLYVARQPFTWSPYGISYLRRLIPIWLYEKSLARGTIDLSGRRQKALLHLIMGDDEWLPTNDQLKQIMQLFIDADNDPVGAMVATRPGIETNELRPGADHWRWDESWDQFTTMKLKSLGVPESIFGDFSVQAAESTISSFLEDMINEREEFTQRIFYNKMFLIIASENDYRLNDKDRELTSSDENRSLLEMYRKNNDYVSYNSQHVLLSADENLDPAEFDLPQIRWEKSLKIVSNDSLFNNLGILAERGMPAPLRMQAALLGVPAQDMFDGLNQDIEDRKLIDEYKKKLPRDASAEAADGEDGGDNSMFMESSDTWRRLIGSNPTARAGTPNRSFEGIEQRDPATGKVLSRKGKQHKVNRENSIMMEAAARIRENSRPEQKRDRKTISFSTRKKL